MGVSIGQLIVALIIIVFLFGKFPNLIKDLLTGVEQLRTSVKKISSSSENTDSLSQKKEDDKKSTPPSAS